MQEGFSLLNQIKPGQDVESGEGNLVVVDVEELHRPVQLLVLIMVHSNKLINNRIAMIDHFYFNSLFSFRFFGSSLSLSSCGTSTLKQLG